MVFARGLCEVGSEAGRWLSGQGQSWTAKQDHASEVRVQAGCVDRGSHVGRVRLRVGLAVLESRRLQLSGVLGGATVCGRGSEVRGAACPRRCGQATKPGLARALNFWVLPEHEEGEAQRSAQGLGAVKEQVLCGHQQGIYVEVAQRVLHFLMGI